MKPIYKYILWAIALILLALASWVIALVSFWPDWGALAIFFGVIALYFGVLYLRRFWLIRKSRAALARSEKAGNIGGNISSSPLKDLSAKFKNAVEVLKNTSLKRFGKPIYVLPWYMVIGESGAGKTTAITRSRLNSTIQKVNQSDPVIQTVNCEWWFFNKAIIIDTAGRYVAPNGIDEDVEEWEKLLDLLAKYRSHEGINGLVLVIDVDRLIKKDQELLEAEGRVLRDRIDQLMRLFDKRFPVYILVTKCDRITGFDAWAEALQAQQIEQAMGYLGAIKDGDGAETNFLDHALNKIQERLKQIRLALAIKGTPLTTSLLLFPSELERLRPGLQHFLAACLGNTPYLEQPLLRGLFFSSGKQTGETIPSELSKLVQVPTSLQHESDKGMFLHDFFGSVLPSDRASALPTMVVNHWRRITRNIGLVSWLSLNLAALIFVLISYAVTVQNIAEIESLYPKYKKISTANLPEAIESLSSLREVVDLITTHENEWTGRWMAFSPFISKMKLDIKAKYVQDLKQMNSAAGSTSKRFGTLLDNPNGPQYANALLGLVRRINLETAQNKGASYEQLMAMPLLPDDLVYALYPELSKDNLKDFNKLLIAYISWSPNTLEYSVLPPNYLEIVTKKTFQTPKMEWLLDWADGLPELRPVTLKSFWVSGSGDPEGIRIRPSLTREGELRIQDFLNELSYMFKNNPEFRTQRNALESWYFTERISAWNTFSWSFPEGQKYLTGEPAWREVVSRLNTVNGPYGLYFNRLNDEFGGYSQDKLPEWLNFAITFDQMRQRKQINSGLFGRISNFFSTFNLLGGKAIRNSLAKENSVPLRSEIKKYIASADIYKAFSADFDHAAGEALSGDGKAYQLAKDLFLFSVDPTVTESKLNNTFVDLKKFRETTGYSKSSNQVVWQLVGGPLEVLMRYTLEQASCSIENDWQKNVVWRTQMALSDDELKNQLYGDQGSAWTFLDGPAKPFVRQRSGQIALSKVYGFTLPFTNEFLPFFNNAINSRVDQMIKEQNLEGIKGKFTRLVVTAKPTGVNVGARAKPFSTSLSVQCSKGETLLNNLNSAANSVINWSPADCGDTTLEVKIDNLVLTKRYPGQMGLVNFVKEFKDGSRVFTPDDFPEYKDKLENLNVKSIAVNYVFEGKDALLAMGDIFKGTGQLSPVDRRNLRRLQTKVPEFVGQCWFDGNPQILDQGSIQKMMQDRVDENLN